jgi:hypothetical protein
VADSTVIAEFLEMDLVVEDNLAGVLSSKGYVLIVPGIKQHRDDQEGQEREQASHLLLLA